MRKILSMILCFLLIGMVTAGCAKTSATETPSAAASVSPKESTSQTPTQTPTPTSAPVPAPTTPKDPVRTDLLNYAFKQLLTLTSLESKLAQDLAAVPTDNDDTFMTKLKTEIIPESDALISKAKAIVPATPEVQKLHNQYIGLLNVQAEAYAMYLKAVQNKDSDLMNSANKKLTSVGDLSDKFLSDLQALEKEHNIEI
jgi:hypothetical protein